MDKQIRNDWALLESDADQIAAEFNGRLKSIAESLQISEADAMYVIDDWIIEARNNGKWSNLRAGTVKTIADLAALGWYDIVRRLVDAEKVDGIWQDEDR